MKTVINIFWPFGCFRTEGRKQYNFRSHISMSKIGWNHEILTEIDLFFEKAQEISHERLFDYTKKVCLLCTVKYLVGIITTFNFTAVFEVAVQKTEDFVLA